MTLLDAIVAEGPSDAAWAALCEHLTAIEGGASLDRALGIARARVATWPARMRRAELASGAPPESQSPSARWLAGLFEGKIDPRLELVGWASIERRLDYDKDPFGGQLAAYRGILLAFARHFEPGFAPPDVLRYQEEDGTHAYGCGGGWNRAAWGDEARGVKHDGTWVEHPSSDESDDAWTVYGLGEATALAIRCHDRSGGYYTFEVAGPAPEALELALAWGALTRDEPTWTLEKAATRLAAARVRWPS